MCVFQVSLEPLLEDFKKNIENVRSLVLAVIPKIAKKDWTSVLKEHEVS